MFTRTSAGADAGPEFTPVSFVPLQDSGREKAAAQGYTRGHSAGYTAGLRAAQAEAVARRGRLEAEHARALTNVQSRLDAALSSLRAATEAINSLALPVIADAQDVLLAASLELAEAVIGHALSDGDFAARSALARVLAQPAVPAVYAVRMHPDDLDALDDATLDAAGVRFIPDPGLGRGDAVAEFEHGRLDARIGTALARAKDALLSETQFGEEP
ncbi:MAG TPA: FliH/SctL family protein [Micrococcaceae bacterium]